MNKKIVVAFIFFLLVSGGLIWFRQQSPNLQVTPNQNKPDIMATFYPLAEFSHQVGGELVEVTTLVPAGVEPHDFDPTPQDIARLNEASLLVYNGAGFESWLDKVLPDLQEKQVKVVNSSQGIAIEAEDPHFWLSPVLAQHQVKNILAGLIQIDPENESNYQTQANQYLQRLQQLDQEFRIGLAMCQSKKIVTSHEAFGYLAKEYGLEVIAIAGLSPDEEPSPQRLAEIVQEIRQHDVKYVFFETLASPALANTIAAETGAQTLEFNPLEGLTQDEISGGREYISVQRENLQNLRLALSCQ